VGVVRIRNYFLKNLKHKYGMTGEEYTHLLITQNSVCALCALPPRGRRRLAVDHCHETGRVRGLLCFSCNTALGTLGDSTDSLERVLKYLKG